MLLKDEKTQAIGWGGKGPEDQLHLVCQLTGLLVSGIQTLLPMVGGKDISDSQTLIAKSEFSVE